MRRSHIRRLGPAILLALIASTLLLPAISAKAHGGVVFPIAEHKPAGPYRISIWADPDVGSALFYVIVESASGQPVDGGLDVHVSVGPVAGQHPSVSYPTLKRTVNGQPEYVASVTENVQGMWRVAVDAEGAAGKGYAEARVEGRMVGLGGWEIALYIFPFAFVTLLFLKGIVTNMRMRS